MLGDSTNICQYCDLELGPWNLKSNTTNAFNSISLVVYMKENCFWCLKLLNQCVPKLKSRISQLIPQSWLSSPEWILNSSWFQGTAWTTSSLEWPTHPRQLVHLSEGRIHCAGNIPAQHHLHQQCGSTVFQPLHQVDMSSYNNRQMELDPWIWASSRFTTAAADLIIKPPSHHEVDHLCPAD